MDAKHERIGERQSGEDRSPFRGLRPRWPDFDKVLTTHAFEEHHSDMDIVMVEPESTLGRVAQWAFRRATDESGWIEDDGQAYIIYLAGFVNAIQLIAERHPDAAAFVQEAIDMLDETS